MTICMPAMSSPLIGARRIASQAVAVTISSATWVTTVARSRVVAITPGRPRSRDTIAGIGGGGQLGGDVLLHGTDRGRGRRGLLGEGEQRGQRHPPQQRLERLLHEVPHALV